jgi:Flp pilus assembly protein TadG
MRRVTSQRHEGMWNGGLAALYARALRSLRRSADRRPGVLRDRRGAIALVFAVSAILLIGFVGLATEAGMWYLVRREAQTAADASAIAGVLAADEASSGNADFAAQSAATALAETNGFTAGTSSIGTVTVTPTYLPASYAYTSNSGVSTQLNQVQVSISEVVIPLISRVFTNSNTGPTVGAQAAAVVEPIGNACALALLKNGVLSIQGTINSLSCGLASNAGNDTAITVTGSLKALTVTAIGGCSGCDPPTTELQTPAAPYHPPTPDPYSGTAGAVTFPTFSGGTCAITPTADSSGLIHLTSYEASSQAYCSTVDIEAGSPTPTLQFNTPGTYIFYNASLIVNAGTIQCQSSAVCSGDGTFGISIVFVGDAPGTLTIGSGGSVGVGSSLNAAKTNTKFPGLDGILFYGEGNSPASITIQSASSSSQIEGAIYFPLASLTFSMFPHPPSDCLSLVAGSLTLVSTFSLAPNNCTSFGTSLPQMQGARLVQ